MHILSPLGDKETLTVFSSTFHQIDNKLPIIKASEKLEKDGRMLNWRGVELGEFNLQFTLKATMKGETLVAFVIEYSISLTSKDQTSLKDTNDNFLWTIYIDGFSNDHVSGTVVILESPDKYIVEHSIIFGFNASNNVAAYEATLARMDLKKTVKAKRTLIKFDF